MDQLTNIPYDHLEVGMEARIKRVCSTDDMYVFAHASGNFNPLNLPSDNKADSVAPSMWVGALISAVLGNKLPGPGTLYLSQTFRFLGRAREGDELTACVRLVEKGANQHVRFATWVEQADGFRIAEGEAEVLAPTESLTLNVSDIPDLMVQKHEHFERLLKQTKDMPPMPTVVVAPEEANSLGGAILAANHELIHPILIGNASKIRQVAAELGADISSYEIIDIPDHSLAAAKAVEWVRKGCAKAIMKGHLHTDQLLKAVLKKDDGLRTDRRLSHVYVMDVPGLDHLLMVTDPAINVAPDLEAKVDIIQNAIDLAQALGVDKPKVGVLSAVETVNPKIPSTLDAAILSKMAERGQIKGGIVDGPLAMDNAIDINAAKTKGIESLVAGKADILVVPNLESGNMVIKELTFFAHAEAGGLVMGARCPIILTSRSDDDRNRLASCAIAVMYAQRLARV